MGLSFHIQCARDMSWWWKAIESACWGESRVAKPFHIPEWILKHPRQVNQGCGEKVLDSICLPIGGTGRTEGDEKAGLRLRFQL